MHFEIAFVLLFAVATAVALLARYLKIPYTVALVVAGLVLGATQAFEAPHLTKELLYAIFLPGLLFEAAFHLEFHKFLQNKIAVFSLAVPGLMTAIGLTAAILTPVAAMMHFVDDFTFLHGLVFASLIAATDPIAVIGLFKSLGAPKRLAILVEGESLLNDGTAVVLFTLILGFAMGDHVTASEAVLDFIRVVGMGILIGSAVGLAITKVIQSVDDPMIEITCTTIAAYGAFVAAEHFHYSGVIATVVAGMLCGNYATRTGMSPSTRIAVESFWEYFVFALNSFVFLLLGLQVHINELVASWKPILAAYAAVTMGRALMIFLTTSLLRRTRESQPWSWATVLTWGGLRGALSMVLVLGLPLDFPHRPLLVTMTFGVVVLSILTQGLTMGPLLRFLKVIGVTGERELYEIQRGKVRAAQAALLQLDALSADKSIHPDIVEELRTEYEIRQEEAEVRLRDLHMEAHELRNEEEIIARRLLLTVEKDTIINGAHQGYLGKEAAEKLLGDLDARLFRLHDSEVLEAATMEQKAEGSAEQAE